MQDEGGGQPSGQLSPSFLGGGGGGEAKPWGAMQSVAGRAFASWEGNLLRMKSWGSRKDEATLGSWDGSCSSRLQKVRGGIDCPGAFLFSLPPPGGHPDHDHFPRGKAARPGGGGARKATALAEDLSGFPWMCVCVCVRVKCSTSFPLVFSPALLQ